MTESFVDLKVKEDKKKERKKSALNIFTYVIISYKKKDLKDTNLR